MVKITIRLVGEEKDRLFNYIELDPQIHVDDLLKKIKHFTNIPLGFQQIQLRGQNLRNSLNPLESIHDFEELVVNHTMLINWRTYIKMIGEIRQMTTSGVTAERREIALKLGVFVFVDDAACYYAKTLGSIPGPEEEIEFPNRPTIDLMEIFVYILLRLIGLGPVEVHVIPDVNKSELLFIATKLIDNFRTASGVSATQMLENSSPEATGRVMIDTEMRKQMRIISSLLCLSDLQRNEDNHGIVERQPTESEKREGKGGPICELRIIDFKVNLGLIDDDPTILNSTPDIPFLKTYFEKWDILNSIYKAREAMENDPALKNNKNVNGRTFDRYFKRLETALRNFLNK